MTVRELYARLDERMPRALSCEWDHDGLAVCPAEETPVTGVLLVLDVTPEAIGEARKRGYNVILTHHPLLFRPLFSLSDATPAARMARECLLSGISVMNFHTRADAAEGGVNDCLIAALGLSPVGEVVPGQMFRMGELPAPVTAAEFASIAASRLHCRALRYTDAGLPVTRVGVCSGAGRDFVSTAVREGCQAYLSGELGHHTLTDAPEMGISAFECGHYETEYPVLSFFEELVRSYDPAIPTARLDVTPIRVL